MKRDLLAMTRGTYDLLIIGGGITGACVAWDASLRGLSVALVEKRDFAHATSAASSKLIHGGLRYLRNFELGLVRESLRERRLWERNAPHMVYPLEFIVPTFGSGMKGRVALGIGLTLYDFLSWDRNRLDDPDQHIARHRSLTRAEAIALEPGLEATALTGAMIFSDCQMYSPERLALEAIMGAVAHGAVVANYAEVRSFIRAEDGDDSRSGTGSGAGRIDGVRVVDVEDGADSANEFEIRARVTLNAAGPWADILMGVARGGRGARRLIRSKGIHLLTRSMTQGHAVTLPTPEGGHFFILPWRGHSIFGTTDTVYSGSPDDFAVTEDDIESFIGVINRGYPAAKLTRSDVLHFYGGMRPLVDRQTQVDIGREAESRVDADANGSEGADSYTASRASEIYDHGREEGVEGMISAIGGKWTTSRHLAEQIVNLAVRKLRVDGGLKSKPAPCVTETTPTYAGDVGRFAVFEREAVARYGELPEPVVRNLARNYGSRFEDVTSLAAGDSRLAKPLSERFNDIGAQIVLAVRSEMAVTLEDVLFRRTGLATLGDPGPAVIETAADLMAEELGWDAERRRREIDRVMIRFNPVREPAGAGSEEV